MADYALDPEVFSFMFDITDVAPSILKVSIPEVYRRVAAGQHVPITVYIVNNSTTPGRIFLMNPTTGPLISIYSPLDTIIETELAMEQLDIGTYTYVYDTTTLTPGPYAAVFSAANSTKEMLSKKYMIFTLI